MISSGTIDIPGLVLAANWTRNLGLAAYGGAALAALVAAALAVRDRDRRPGALFWGAIAIVFAALTVDLLTNFRFEVAKPVRAWVRGREGGGDVVLTVALSLLGALALAAAALLFLRRHRPGTAALAGTFLAVLVWGAEAISHHELSQFLWRGVGPVALVSLLWFAAGALAVVGAIRSRR